MNNTVFRYDIRNAEIAKELITYGFTLVNTTPGIWTLEAPENISATKSRKIISTMIKLYVAAKEVSRAQKRYEGLLNKMNSFNLAK